MSKVSKHFPIFILAAVLGAPAMRAQTLPPRIFFTDLTSGPATGNSDSTFSSNGGVYVTLYGNFLTSPTVALNGAACLVIVSQPSSWMWYQKMVVQLTSSCTTGNFVVTTAGGTSNGIPFTVRAGNIYYVATNGNDSTGTGSFSKPWATIVQAKNTIAAGDTAYIENGVQQTTGNGDNSSLDVRSGSGTAAAPKALVAYPGASVTISSTDRMAVRTVDSDSTSHWVIAGISAVTAVNNAFELDNVTDFRIIGNDIFCPNGDDASACFHGDGGNGTDIKLLGNNVHNTGNTCVSQCHVYHAVYFSTNNNSWEAAWNIIAPDPGKTGVGGCKGLEVYSTGGADQFDIHVHDNVIHDVICDGIDLNTVNPDGTNTMGGQGSVEVYNNVIYRAGTGPPPNSESDYACVEVGTTAARTNPIQIYNNSFYDCGSRGNADSGGISYSGDATTLKLVLRNNIFQATGNSEPYFTSNSASGCSTGASGSNNLWFGAGGTPCGSQFTSNVNSDPLFVDPVTARNFHLQSGSPAKDAGVAISTLATDLDGVTRPQGPAYDIGAYEFVNGSVTVRPNPPTNLKAVVQ